MSYTLPNWVDQPSTTSPLSSANLLEYNSAINDLDSRVAGTQPLMSTTSTNSSTFSATINTVVLVDTTFNNVTVNLPSAPVDGSRICVKQTVQGGTNTVTVQASGLDKFNNTSGSTTSAITLLRQSALYQYFAASKLWITISNDLPLDQADARYVPLATYGNTYQQGGAYDYNVCGDVFSNMTREDAVFSYAFSASIKTQLNLIGWAPAGSYSSFKICVTTLQSGVTLTAALYGSSTLTSTSWTRLGAGNITPSVAAVGVVSTSLPFTLSTPTFVLAQLVLTSGSVFPAFAAANTAQAGLTNPATGMCATSSATTAPGATLNPSTGFTNTGTKIWCALA